MEKTILLGSTGTLSPKANKYLFIALGLMYSGLSVSMLLEEGITFMASAWMFTGLFFIIWAILTFTVTPITPQVHLSQHLITYRKSPFKKTQKLKWSGIKSIEFSAYQITFHFAEHKHSLSYQANSATSIEIKNSIREFAENLGIEVTGG